MKRHVFIGLTMILIWSGFSVHGYAEETQAPAAPQYKNNEWWEYEASIYRAEGTAVRTNEMQPGRNRVVIKNGAPEGTPGFIRTTNAIIYNNDMLEQGWLKFPLGEGREWEFKYFREERGKWGNGKTKVLGFEKVTTPAGTFEAYKLYREMARQEATYYYSPKVKAVVKFHRRVLTRSGEPSVEIKYELVGYGTE